MEKAARIAAPPRPAQTFAIAKLRSRALERHRRPLMQGERAIEVLGVVVVVG
jgi:hypothetical protein